jgi:hypothetical protein
MQGGRRRKTRKTRKSRKMRGGNGYGVGQPIAVGALEYVPNMTSVPGGAPTPGPGGRRRKSKKSRRGRRRTMKGGATVAHTGTSFTGSGAERGMGGFQAYSHPFSNDVVPLA